MILAVGRLAPEKDFPTLIRAFAQVHQHRPSRLVILGDGPAAYETELVNLVAQLGLTDDVLFHGFVENPYAYMTRSDVLVVSSLREGLSNVIIEALSLNLPIVATACGGPEELLDHGKYGTLVPIGQSQAMGQAITTALSENKPQAPVEWLAQFTTPVVAAHYLELLSPSLPEQQQPFTLSTG